MEGMKWVYGIPTLLLIVNNNSKLTFFEILSVRLMQNLPFFRDAAERCRSLENGYRARKMA